jgi:heme-degrading monooxygenase HmoA
LRGVTTKQFDQSWEDLRKAGHSNPKGLLHHTGAQNGRNFMVVDVWESQEAFSKFGETLMPIMAKNGIKNPVPLILPVHFEYEGK